MIYRFRNPFLDDGTITEVNTVTGHVWHIYQSGRRERSSRNADYWLPMVPDLAMEVGL